MAIARNVRMVWSRPSSRISLVSRLAICSVLKSWSRNKPACTMHAKPPASSLALVPDGLVPLFGSVVEVGSGSSLYTRPAGSFGSRGSLSGTAVTSGCLKSRTSQKKTLFRRTNLASHFDIDPVRKEISPFADHDPPPCICILFGFR